ncbi:SpoIIE family protein phosphatase [Streptomyces sp. MI02-7b]|uniref:SpoIIE family protein phosphatase n=1 Tax=Streptomyces sp. MI02-7b TaxID=462941 RepID=UPI0029BE4F82|nr:SpoIIE family protein phosphatase [Streptomyces sp. MI02-7b]MDX3073363.1 SpoIIE family protein phosphatase [Streptomyces sp. MI02-7b]
MDGGPAMVVTAPVREQLDETLAEVVRATNAHIGAVFLVLPEGRGLGLEVLTGAPRELATPWARMALNRSAPVADAVRTGRLVWLGTREELAERYPQTALVLPYDLALAAAPLQDAAHLVRGALMLIWPGSHPEPPAGIEHAVIGRACDVMCEHLQHAESAGDPVRPGPLPRVLDRPGAARAAPDEAQAAADFARRLPEGGCALDQSGRITYVSGHAELLLGESAGVLLGALPWQVLPWLHDAVHEDRYRGAVLSGQPTSFIARRPPDHWLLFQLYPDRTGVSVRISPTDHRPEPAPRAPGNCRKDAAGAAPDRVTAIYHLMQLAGALAEAVGVRDVVELVADLFPPAFGADGFVLVVAEGGRLRVIGHRGYDEEAMAALDGTPLGSRLTPASRALLTGVPRFYSSPEELLRAYPGLTGSLRKSAWALLPLIASGRPVGCCILGYDHPRPFRGDERSAMASLTALIAQALDRARIYDAKHRLAHGLQAALLPHTLPSLPGLEVAARYLPATSGMDIGGDFYDLIRLDGTCAAAVIGDVQGHNVNAAALMGQVRTAVHAHATAGASPDEVLARTNRLLDELDTGLFTSCLYVHLDLAEGIARLASAGHPPPLLRHPGGRTEVLTTPPGLLLGIDPHAEYPTTEVPLPPEAVLALYTDGLVESPGTDLDTAIAGLAGALSAAGEGPLDRLAETLVHFDGASEHRVDDTALLLLRRMPAA